MLLEKLSKVLNEDFEIMGADVDCEWYQFFKNEIELIFINSENKVEVTDRNKNTFFTDIEDIKGVYNFLDIKEDIEKLNKSLLRKVYKERSNGNINFEYIEYNQAIDILETGRYTESQILNMSFEEIDNIYYDMFEDDSLEIEPGQYITCEKCGHQIGLTYTDNTSHGDGYEGICKCGNYKQISIFMFEN